MKKFLSLLLMLMFVSSVAYGQSSSYYYEKAQECAQKYEYHMREARWNQKWAESYYRDAQNADTSHGARSFMNTAQQYEKAAQEHYANAQRCAQEAEKYKRQADNLARQGR